jgi:transcriptional regulator with XRE-family HTH domain
MLRLREERHRRGWSLTRLSAKTGIASSDLSAVERERRIPFPGWKRRIAKVFRMAARDLFASEPPVKAPSDECEPSSGARGAR